MVMDYQTLHAGIASLEGHHAPALPWQTDLRPAAALSAVPLVRAGRFWRETERPQAALAQAVMRLLSGFRQAHAPWGWLIECSSSHVRLQGLVPGGESGAQVWRQCAAAAVPGMVFGAAGGAGVVARSLARYAHSVAFIGGHSRMVQEPEPLTLDLSRLSAAAHGADWAYVVLAQPIAMQAVQRELTALQAAVNATRSTYLRRGTAEEGNHPLAQRYLALVEAEQARLSEGGSSGLWQVQACLLSNDERVLTAGAHAVTGHLAGTRLRLSSWRAVHCGAGGRLAASYLTLHEAASLLALPTEEVAGLPMRSRVPFARHGAAAPGPGVEVGRVMADGVACGDWFQLPLGDFARHGLVCGTPGSGKTRTAQFLLRQLWEEHRVPFLVLDPAKSDYEQLLASPLGGDLRVFTPGLPGGADFVFNPLAVPAGVPVQLHADGVKALLLASFGWVAPMPEVLILAVHEVYEQKGWDFITGSHPAGHTHGTQPTISDLIAIIPSVVLECGYDPEVSANIEAGLSTRLRSLIRGGRGAVLDASSSVPLAWLLEKPALIELGWFGNNEERAFLMGALVLALGNHRRMQGTSARLRHVLCVEEAHRLLSAPPASSGGESGTPRQKAVEEFCQLLAEIRAYGQGLLVVEQMPTALPAALLANTALKLCHHLVHEADRRAVGGTMNLRDDQRHFLAGLSPGEALAVRAGCAEAFHLAVPDHAGRLGFGQARISRPQIREHMQRHPPPG